MNPWDFHPALVHFPIAFLLAATTLDVVGFVQVRNDPTRSATSLALARLSLCLLVAGVLSSLVAASAGILAYFTVPPHSQETQVRMLVHVLFAVSATLVYAVLLLRRRRGPALLAGSEVGFSVVGAALLGAAGALGGYLVYHDGVAVPEARGMPEGTSAEHLERLFEGD